jgi:hypothetical protein
MASLVKLNNLLIRRPSVFIYKYIKQFSFDYRDALIDTGKKMLQHPIKTIFYSSSISLLIYAYQTMPSFQSYRNDLITFRHQELLTSSLIRNKQIEIYLDTIEKLLARDQIHFVDCYLFSLIIYRSQHRSNENSSKFYENICSYLHLKRNARIIDIGGFHRWFSLNRQLQRADLFDDMNNEKKIALS